MLRLFNRTDKFRSGRQILTSRQEKKKLTRLTTLLNVIFGLTVLLFLFDSLTPFDIRSHTIKSFVYHGLLIETPLILLWNFFALKSKTKRIVGTIIPTLILTLILIVGPMTILFSTRPWLTQTILYQNGHLSFRTVEFQMQDIGALGYNKRTVEVFYLTNLFMIVSDPPQDIGKKTEWIKVDKDINASRLKY